MCAVYQRVEDDRLQLLGKLIERTGGINDESIGHRLKHLQISEPLAVRLVATDFRLPLLQDLGRNIEQDVEIRRWDQPGKELREPERGDRQAIALWIDQNVMVVTVEQDQGRDKQSGTNDGPVPQRVAR